GGAIKNDGALTIQDSVISNNTNGAAGSTGGALWASGRLDILRSTISNNTSSGDAGAIYSSFVLNITNSTVSNNTAAANSQGGAIKNDGGSVDFIASNASSNFAPKSGGFLYNLNGNVRLINSTITDNRNGIDGNGGTISTQI